MNVEPPTTASDGRSRAKQASAQPPTLAQVIGGAGNLSEAARLRGEINRGCYAEGSEFPLNFFEKIFKNPLTKSGEYDTLSLSREDKSSPLEKASRWMPQGASLQSKVGIAEAPTASNGL